MRKLSLLIMLTLVGCGSIEGNWTGSCENPATSEVRTFNLDIDTDDRSGVTGSAFMTIDYPAGDSDILECTVTGDSESLDFSCEEQGAEARTFTIDFTKDGGDLVGYCDADKKVELRLVQD